MNSEFAISFKNVSFSYGGGALPDAANHAHQSDAQDDTAQHGVMGDMAILRGVSFDIPRGQLVALIGGNGSGKSTIARLVSALVFAQRGEVSVSGCTSTRETPFDVRRHVGLVMQNPDDQIVASLVENEVAFGPENLGIPADEIHRRIQESLELVELAGFEKRETNSLSGGQKQRLALAGALAMYPDVLVLDEATSMLDPESRKRLMDVIARLSRGGTTVLMITHHMDEAMQADRVIVLDRGIVEMDGSPEEVIPNCKMMRELHERKQKADTLSAHTRFMGAESASLPLIQQEKHSTTSSDSSKDISNFAHNEEDALVRFEGVSYKYTEDGTDAELWALRDIDLDIYNGEFISVIGPTGSGKSTLIQHMNGLMHPTTGCVLFRGLDLSVKENANRARTRVGVVFQYPERQLFAATVYDDVAYGPRNKKFGEDEVERCVRDALKQVELDFDEVSARNPFHLSGGQQRRVAVAGILAMQPEVLVMDEPCAGLDPLAHFDFLQLIRKLHECGMTIVMVTHDHDDAEALSTRVIHMEAGRITSIAAHLPRSFT